MTIITCHFDLLFGNHPPQRAVVEGEGEQKRVVGVDQATTLRARCLCDRFDAGVSFVQIVDARRMGLPRQHVLCWVPEP